MRRRMFDLSVSVVSLALLGFFAWHGLRGDRGVEHQKSVVAEVVQLKADLARVRDERNKLDARVALLRPQSIDPDLLDEMARRTLGYVREREIVIDLRP